MKTVKNMSPILHLCKDVQVEAFGSVLHSSTQCRWRQSTRATVQLKHCPLNTTIQAVCVSVCVCVEYLKGEFCFFFSKISFSPLQHTFPLQTFTPLLPFSQLSQAKITYNSFRLDSSSHLIGHWFDTETNCEAPNRSGKNKIPLCVFGHSKSCPGAPEQKDNKLLMNYC